MGELTLRMGITATYIKEEPTKCSHFIIAAKLENIGTHLMTC